jgi:hypothetical protein
MRVSVISLRIGTAEEAAPGADADGPATWAADVHVTWRTPEMGAGRAVSQLTYTFVSVHGHARVAGVQAQTGSREPVWLAGRMLVVRRPGHVVAVAATLPAARILAHRLQVARRDVARWLPRKRASLTAYLPPSSRGFDSLLGTAPGQENSAAAVTTTVDGSHAPDAPVAIMLNPRVWPRLRPAGAHVVVTHEAVHAITGSVTTDLPAWVSEGFADYVALTSAHVPAQVANAEAVAGVRDHGLPHRLPRNADFQASGACLEATYELSRLVMATIAHHYGRRRLTDFYLAMVARPVLDDALRRELHTTSAGLTRQWRHRLVRLAGAQ